MFNDHLTVENTHYDVVIVGAGIAGAILSHVLGSQGKKVLVLEAGKTKDFTYPSYLDYLDTFYKALAKVPDSPYPLNPNAPQPDVLDIRKITPDNPDTTGYFVQMGPLPFASTYTRVPGGTTMHWLGTCLRMLPEDFKLQSNYGHGLDWPIGYDDLLPYYEKAEREIGVSANVDEQKYLTLKFTPGYEYPMHKIPQSFLDKTIATGVEGMTMEYDGQAYDVFVSSTPQGRNSVPNDNYDGGKGYTPVGAVGNPDLGNRCEGNTSCVPICPVQAKYNAMKTLSKALDTGNVTLITQAVASEVLLDENGRVNGIQYKAYVTPGSPEHTVHIARGTKFVLAAHAVENAKLLLQSGITSTSGLVGKNLMDHPVMNTWALMPEKIGSFRGPLSTSGIESLRGGNFRKERSAFRIEIGNEGWNWATGDPYTTVTDLVENENLFGKELIKRINDKLPRQFRLGFLMEQIPEVTNSVTIDPQYTDQLGNCRPIINYNLPDYVRKGMQVATETANQIYARLGAENYTSYSPSDPTYLTYEGQGFEYGGAGHFAGTHIMGTTPENSVVDGYQRSWDHDNLYLNGCGSFPTVGTSNPTLTMAALTFRTADHILKELNKEAGDLAISGSAQ
ncbi:MAG: GMC family oxidoreductase [Tumebacillaceae bacterium]